MDGTTPERADIVLSCGVCGPAARMMFPGFHVAKRKAKELSDELIAAAVKVGWSRRQLTSEGVAQAICPDCVQWIEARQAKAREPLPRFTPDEALCCASCGHTDVGTTFCRGNVSTCKLGQAVDHLHRQCRRCSFEWYEQPKQESDNGKATVPHTDQEPRPDSGQRLQSDGGSGVGSTDGGGGGQTNRGSLWDGLSPESRRSLGECADRLLARWRPGATGGDGGRGCPPVRSRGGDVDLSMD